MRFKDVFSIIGPAMVGPSSSHTAGAVRIGKTAFLLFGGVPEQAEITLFGSFADTGKGHGTDAAMVGGLLGYEPDDMRIPNSLEYAKKAGLNVRITIGKGHARHPNTAKLKLIKKDKTLFLTGSSIGGGNIEITEVNGFDVQFSSKYPTLVIVHDDRTGLIAEVTNLLSKSQINIGHMDVDRKGRNREAMTVIETDSLVSAETCAVINALPSVHQVINLNEGGRDLL